MSSAPVACTQSTCTGVSGISKRIIINCSGVCTQISLALLQHYPQTLLAQLTSHLVTATTQPSQTTTLTEFFFDRDPASVNVILNWYRYGKCIVPPSVPYELVADDIVYFKLPIVIDATRHAHLAADMNAINSSTQGSPSLGPTIHPDLRKLNSYPMALANMSRTNSQFVETREYPPQADEAAAGSNSSTLAPPSPMPPTSANPPLNHLPSFALQAGMVHQPSYIVNDGDLNNTAVNPTIVNILPPTPPILTPAHSTAPGGAGSTQQFRPASASVTPLLVHQSSSILLPGGGILSPTYTVPRSLSPRPSAVSNYLALGANDVEDAGGPSGDGFPSVQLPPGRAASVAVVGSVRLSHPSGLNSPPESHPSLAKAHTNPPPAATAYHALTNTGSTPPLTSPTASTALANHAAGASMNVIAAAPSPATSAVSTAASASNSDSNAATAPTSATVVKDPPAAAPATSAASFAISDTTAASTPANSSAAVTPATSLIPAAAVPSNPRPPVPFDLAIEMLSCFKDVNRAQALALLDGAAASSAGGDASGSTATSVQPQPVPEGSYLFRYCNDANEKDSQGNINKDLFVLSYMHERKLFNTKIWRLHLGPTNSIGARTMRGWVLSEHREPIKKEQTFTGIMDIALSIIGQHAQALP